MPAIAIISNDDQLKKLKETILKLEEANTSLKELLASEQNEKNTLKRKLEASEKSEKLLQLKLDYKKQKIKLLTDEERAFTEKSANHNQQMDQVEPVELERQPSPEVSRFSPSN